jgi:ABC-type multidrug transport system permease subunit
VRDLPPWWLWMQVVLVAFVVIGMVIAIIQLASN